ncbi:MAG: DUF1778 domain-containing protein [Rhodospirillales bacterium]
MTVKTEETKNERVQFRVDRSTKRLIERAAALSNMTVSGFVVASALSEASRLVAERERLTLSERDWAIFAKALAKPPPPSAALKAAFAEHDRVIASE